MDNRIPVGIKTPYESGNKGFFEQTYSDIERAKINLNMLLLTARGERPMMPTYGSGLREILFEQNDESYVDDIFLEEIKSTTEKWMPEVDIYDVIVTRDIDKEPNKANIMIVFGVENIPGSEETLNLEVYA